MLRSNPSAAPSAGLPPELPQAAASRASGPARVLLVEVLCWHAVATRGFAPYGRAAPGRSGRWWSRRERHARDERTRVAPGRNGRGTERKTACALARAWGILSSPSRSRGAGMLDGRDLSTR